MPYNLDDLQYLMRRLRDINTGCPWDLKQTEETIINYSIEEVYELLDAIERDDKDDIRNELGDVLFQVIFLSRLAEEKGDFDLAAVIDSLCNKLIRRHPHVFIRGELYAEPKSNEKTIQDTDVATQWEAIKASERKEKSLNGLFDDIPLSLPSLIRATKVQKRASSKGFDWPSVEGAVEKLEEEIAELKQVLSQIKEEDSCEEAIADELGDVLFSTVNIARHMQQNAEACLRQSTRKFIQRMDAVIQLGMNEGKNIQEFSPKELNGLWDEAKRQLNT